MKTTNPELAGVRVCAVCGTGWKSSMGMAKDLGMFGSGMISGTYSPENLAGLTCSACGKSFCKPHLGQPIPSRMPGGRCPSCGGALDLC